MTHYIYNIAMTLVLAASMFSANAQTKEYIQAFIDKDCYLTGEQVLVHVSVTDEKQQPMNMSKVAYVELCDTHQIQAQCMVQLKEGEGWAKLDLPGSMHSGNYQMNVYTRYQRNFGPDCYYKRIVAVVNLLNPSSNDDVEFIEQSLANNETEGPTQLSDKKEYATREKVLVNLPKIEGRSLTLSVYRKDCSNEVIKTSNAEPTFSMKNGMIFVPELEGHIVTAKNSEGLKIDNSRLALVGKNSRLFDGQPQTDGTMRYYTHGLNGSLPVTINGYTYEDDPIHMEFVQPYEVILPDSLPTLKVYYNEKDLKDRSISAQIEKSKRDISLGEFIGHETTFMGIAPEHMYDLDEYTKFMSVREILIEFVNGIQSRTVNKHKVFFTYEVGTYNYSKLPALVLLDGMPVYDIDALLNYDARRLKYVQIYRGRFQFGENACQGVISFISKKGSLQDFLLDKGTQMYTYDFPQNRPVFLSPIYENKDSRQPDFRHTLYFNLEVKNGTYEFYTSDLPGTYKISLQYVGTDQREYSIESEFTVK